MPLLGENLIGEVWLYSPAKRLLHAAAISLQHSGGTLRPERSDGEENERGMCGGGRLGEDEGG